MPLNRAIKDRIVEIIEGYIQDDLDFGHIYVEDIVDDLNYIIENSIVKPLVYEECVKQLNRLGEDGILDTEDKEYAISQLHTD